MGLTKRFLDSITSVYNELANRRNATNTNVVTSQHLDYREMREIYKTGLGSKIIRLKVGHALKKTLQFTSKEDEEFYNRRLRKVVKRAARWMAAYGRGIVVIQEPGADLSEPLRDIDPMTVRLRVFSGDMVNPYEVSMSLDDEMYMKPKYYSVRGFSIHHSRVVDFTYVEPDEMDAPRYRYGGISEFELIRAQIVNDGVVERALAGIIEKNSSLFYKVKGFKEAMDEGRHQPMVEYFKLLEDRRSIYGAALLDAEDEASILAQTLPNLSEADIITLRRIAMVTGIPMPYLIGENVKGLNASGENERQAMQDMIEAFEEDYLLDPINLLMSKLGQGEVSFKENQGDTPLTRVEYESKVLANAAQLSTLGEDYRSYLTGKGIVAKDEFDQVFGDIDDDDELDADDLDDIKEAIA